MAVSALAPAGVESVQLPTAAIPFASVVWADPVTLPLPAPAAKVTDTPDTGLSNASVTITDGGGAPGAPPPPGARREVHRHPGHGIVERIGDDHGRRGRNGRAGRRALPAASVGGDGGGRGRIHRDVRRLRDRHRAVHYGRHGLRPRRGRAQGAGDLAAAGTK